MIEQSQPDLDKFQQDLTVKLQEDLADQLNAMSQPQLAVPTLRRLGLPPGDCSPSLRHPRSSLFTTCGPGAEVSAPRLAHRSHTGPPALAGPWEALAAQVLGVPGDYPPWSIKGPVDLYDGDIIMTYPFSIM